MSCGRQRGENDFETPLKPFPGVPRQICVLILLGHEWLPGSMARFRAHKPLSHPAWPLCFVPQPWFVSQSWGWVSPAGAGSVRHLQILQDPGLPGFQRAARAFPEHPIRWQYSLLL